MILAVDPGLKGAFAFMDKDTCDIIRMPVKKATISRREKTVLDYEVILLWMDMTVADTLVIEQVNGAPGQSAPSAFTFGWGVGVIETAARCKGMGVVRVPAATWKTALKVPSDKILSMARATTLMPQWAHQWPRKGDDGKAEAAMIGYYWLNK